MASIVSDPNAPATIGLADSTGATPYNVTYKTSTGSTTTVQLKPTDVLQLPSDVVQVTATSLDANPASVISSDVRTASPLTGELPPNQQPSSNTLNGLPPGNNFSIIDTSTRQSTSSAGEVYTGPVMGVQEELVLNTSDNVSIAAAVPNVFIHTQSGMDVIKALSGTNVLDGGQGSNFLVGGSGTDTFFVDARNPSGDIWSTIVNFHRNDAATLWGVTVPDFGFNWVDNQGAPGSTGLTLHVTEPGKPTASLTLVGYSTADLANGRLSISFGSSGGSPYMYVHANA